MGSIERLPSGNMSAIARDPATGKRRRQGFKGSTYESQQRAWAWIRAQEAGWDGLHDALGQPVTRQRRGVPSAAEWFARWAPTVVGELATRRSAASHGRSLAAHFGSTRVDQIDRLMVREYLGGLHDAGLSWATREKRLSTLRAAMIAAIEAGHCTIDPTAGVKGPKRITRPDRIITEHELAAVTEALPGGSPRGHHSGANICPHHRTDISLDRGGSIICPFGQSYEQIRLP